MAKAVPMPPFDEVSRLLRYEPTTGEFFWRVRRGGKADAGDRAGNCSGRGYIKIRIRGRLFLAHRLAWFLTSGEAPDLIDHINGDISDNRLCNLRVVTHTQNNQNRKMERNNAAGFKGVIRDRSKFRARIRLKGQVTVLGSFDTPEEAHAAYCKAAVEQFGKFARFI